MENQQNLPDNENTAEQNDDFNANSAYSGSGSMQPGGDTGQVGQEDAWESNAEEAAQQSDNPLKSADT